MALVRMHTREGCCAADFAAGQVGTRFPTIKAPVGRGGANQRSDTTAIQTALNKVPPELGGANPKLNPDGLVGPKTIGAIEAFQLFQFPEKYVTKKPDGRVDVKEFTISRLRDMCELVDLYGPNVVAFYLVRRPIRMARAAAGVSEARSAVRKGRFRIESALDHLRGMPDFAGGNAQAFRLASLYFALDKLSQEVAFQHLLEIRQSFISVAVALDGSGLPGLPSGAAIFEIDPANKPVVAYSPRRSVQQASNIDPYKVYLCEGADTLNNDLFNHVLVHELFHMTDDETAKTEIVDKGYREKAMRLPHALRMRNSDNYALFATHCHIGRARLVASQPVLTPLIPETI